MFRKLRLYYYNNKKMIWIVIGMVIFVIVIIQLLNYIVKNRNEEILSNTNLNVNSSVESNETYLPSTTSSVISNSNVSERDLEEDTDIIEEFVNYGNSKDVEGAYNLLSQDCKDEMFSTSDRFYNNYFKDVFSEKRSYDLETWDSSGSRTTYRIKYLNNVMATGTVNEEFIEDYITVVEENNEKKLNLNQFINKVDLEKKASKDGLDVSVISKCYYYDYETFEITFQNNSEKTVVLDSKNDTETVYVKDSNNVRYPWFGNEIANEYLTINPGESRTLKIKFNKMYNSERKDETVNFTDVLIGEEKTDLVINI